MRNRAYPFRHDGRAQRTRRADRIGIWLIAVAVVAFIVLFGASYHFERTSVRRDAASLCLSSGPRGLTVVLLDRTDFLTAPQREDLRRRLHALAESVPVDAAFSVYSVGPTAAGLLEPAFQRCNPGRGDDANPLIANPRRLRERWERGFAQPVAAAVDALLQPQNEPQSPIMESIQSVGIAAFGNTPVAIPRHLIVVSDMLQHTRELSQYNGAPDFAHLRDTAYYRKVATDLDGVDVTILYLRRDGQHARQGKDHIRFWQQYFEAMGATLSRVIALQG